MPAESVGGHRPPYINCLLVLGLVHRVDTAAAVPVLFGVPRL